MDLKKEIKKELNLKIKELEILLKDKEKEISEEKAKINNILSSFIYSKGNIFLNLFISFSFFPIILLFYYD